MHKENRDVMQNEIYYAKRNKHAKISKEKSIVVQIIFQYNEKTFIMQSLHTICTNPKSICIALSHQNWKVSKQLRTFQRRSKIEIAGELFQRVLVASKVSFAPFNLHDFVIRLTNSPLKSAYYFCKLELARIIQNNQINEAKSRFHESCRSSSTLNEMAPQKMSFTVAIR